MGLTPQRLIRTFDQEGYSPYHSILSPQRRASLLVPLPLDSSASLRQNSAAGLFRGWQVAGEGLGVTGDGWQVVG